MRNYALLLRGINVGGKNLIPMAALRDCLQSLDFEQVITYIASGNVAVRSVKPAAQIRREVEAALAANFVAGKDPVRVLVLSQAELHAVITNKPAGFGDQPDTYHSDAIFLIDTPVDQVLSAFNPRPEVDTVWPGLGVIYSQRLSAQRTKSRLNTIAASPHYQAMTIRTWRTVLRLHDIVAGLVTN